MAIICDEGKLELTLARKAYLETCKIGIFVNDLVYGVGTTIGDIVPASWSGYAPVTLGTLNAPTIIGARATTTPVTPPQYTNGSGAPVNYFGWYAMKSDGTKLVHAVNLGLQTVLPGATFALMLTFALRGE